MSALRQPPIIADLTEPLFKLRRAPSAGDLVEQPISDYGWHDAIHFLADFGLLVIQSDGSDSDCLLDCHPLIREYFGSSSGRGRTSPAIKLAHRRLFEHLKLQTPPSERPSLEQLEPMYQAVRHGCLAGLFQESLDVFREQMTRESTTYSITFLGAFSSDLSCLANFFQNGWTQVAPEFEDSDIGLLGTAGYSLRGIGRLLEALPPSLESANRLAGIRDVSASIASKNLAELWMALGDLESAAGAAATSVQRADDLAESKRSWLWQDLEVEMMSVINRTCLASILHARGERDSAMGLCINAEHRQRGVQPQFPVLYSEQGFHFFQIIAQPIERLSWVMLMRNAYGIELDDSRKEEELVSIINIAWPRIDKGLQWARDHHFPLDLGLTYLANYQIATWVRRIFPDEAFYAPFATEHLDQAMNWLRRAGDAIHFVAGLIAGSVHHKSTGDAGAASQYLDEAWDIAERGPMRLHLADIHLHRARLFFREAQYPWKSPQVDLAAAEKLINDCGYHRRDEELADAKAVLLAT